MASIEPLGRRLAGIKKRLDFLHDRNDWGNEESDLLKEEGQIEGIIVDRNLRGKELEKQGDIEGAIKLYEQNVADQVDTPHPYDRLAAICHRQKRQEAEIAILEKAIGLFGTQRFWKEKWQKQLAKARKAREREKGGSGNS